MCKFCEKKSVGDCFGEEPVVCEKFETTDQRTLITSVMIDPDEKTLALAVGSDDGKLDKEFTQSIKFCPLCGRML